MKKTFALMFATLPLALFGTTLGACGSETEQGPARETPADAAPTTTATSALPDASAELDASVSKDAGKDASRTDGGTGPDSGNTDSTDGICNPGVVTSGIFDPDCVYIVGTLLPGSSGWDVIMHPSQPTVYARGFGDHVDSPTIRPKDGRLQWHAFSTLYLFQPDNVAGGAATSVVVANDTLISTPACPTEVAHGFIFPDDSVSAYQCFNSASHPGYAQHVYVEGQASPLASGGTDINPLAVGAGRSALFRKYNGGASPLYVFDGTTLRNVVDPSPSLAVAAVRFRGGAFMVAVQRSFSPDQIDLMRITPNGVMTKVGSYELGVPDTVYDQCVLDPAGDMYCFTEQLALHDKVRRFSINAAPDVIYDPTGKPVQLHIPYLVTGP